MPLSPPPQPPIISQEKEDGSASIVAIVFLSSCIFRVKTAVCVHPPTPLLSNHKIPHWKKKSPKSLNGLQSKKKRKDELNSIWGAPKGCGYLMTNSSSFCPKNKKNVRLMMNQIPHPQIPEHALKKVRVENSLQSTKQQQPLQSLVIEIFRLVFRFFSWYVHASRACTRWRTPGFSSYY